MTQSAPPESSPAPSAPPAATRVSRGPALTELFGGALIMVIIASALLSAAKFGGWWWLGPAFLGVLFFFWYLGVRRNFYRTMEAALYSALNQADRAEQEHLWLTALDGYYHAGEMAIRLRQKVGEQAAIAGRDRCSAAADLALERLAFVLYGLHSGREKALANLRQESVVNLTGLNARDEDLEALPGLPCLNRLHLRGRFITDKTLRAAARARGLIEIYLEQTAITDAGLADYVAHAWLPNSPERSAAREEDFLRRNPAPAPVEPWDTDAAINNTGSTSSLPGEVNDLKFLHIEGSPITDAGCAHLAALTRLERLSLHKTRVTGAGLAAIQNLPLVSLSLEGLAIDNAATPAIAALHHTLTRLELFDTGITDAGCAPLGSLSNLTRLNLTGTRITDAGLTHLQPLKNLQFLQLNATRVTAEGIAALKTALPNCQISL